MKNHLIKFQFLLFVLFFLLTIPNLAYSKNNFSIFLDEVASEALSLGISKKVINDFKKNSVISSKSY